MRRRNDPADDRPLVEGECEAMAELQAECPYLVGKPNSFGLSGRSILLS
jgi:hypothetical protein